VNYRAGAGRHVVAPDRYQSIMTEDTSIRELDQETVARIAAGEVVERPASVLKELVENSLDADAGRIDVTVEGGGTELLRVRDDGIGMTRADVEAAVREHTTSKLTDASELQSVSTLGFRGEALHTIGAVSRMTITTRKRGGDGTGTRLEYVGGDVETVEPAGHPEGTTVEMTELFYNTPARRKYLAEEQTEFRHVSKVLGRYALANPDVAVSLTHDDREVFATTGSGDLQSAIMAVYGREVAESMLRVEAEFDDEGVPLDRVEGYVSHPETTRSRAEYIAGYVNERYVETEEIRDGVVEAYGGQLAADRYPFAVLFVDMPAERVDVNVHPRKLAVRFDDATGVRSAVKTAVREALLSEGLLRSSAPRGRSAPEETPVQPGDPDETPAQADDSDETPAQTSNHDETSAQTSNHDETPDMADERADGVADQQADASDIDPAAANARPSGSEDSPASPSERGGETAEPVESATPEVRSDPDDGASGSPGVDSVDADEDSAAAADTSVQPSAADSAQGTLDDGATGTNGSGSENASGSTVGSGDGRIAGDSGRRKFDATDQRTLDGTEVSRTEPYDRLPPLRVLGQAHETFLVAESPDGLVLVDQHAADERIQYERLRDALDADSTTQALASPVELSLTPDEAAVVDEYEEALARLGFHVDCEGTRLSVRTVPSVLGEQLSPEHLRDVFGTLLSADESAADATVSSLASDLLADLACAPAVTGNTSLTEGSIQELLAALDDCENPYACPHGRPTIVELETDELERRFERDYPGHGERRQ